MATRPLPRYFVPGPDSEWPDDGKTGLLEPSHAIDSFFLGGRHVVEREWLVTIDVGGGLRPMSDDELSGLPSVVQQDLAFNEVIGSAAQRSIEGTEFYLFHLEALEQPPETPGLNDPVYLYGTLYGPFPSKSQENYRGIQGQLTVNRIDLLAGFVNSAPYSFHYQTGAGGSTQRCFNILLPGDREEEIMRGKGIVFAYPLMPGDIGMGEPWNEFLVSNLIFDMLTALKDDLEKENVSHPLCRMTLPVTSRYSLEQELQSRGYVIKGEVASRPPGAAIGLPSLVTKALGCIVKDTYNLPPEGDIDEYMRIARDALSRLPGYPPPRTKALASRVHAASVEARAGTARKTAAAPRVINTPTGNVSQPPPAKARKADWMNDFIETHRTASNKSSNSSETRLTNLNQIAAQSAESSRKHQASRTPAKPSWMNDFQQEAPDKKEERTESKPKKASENRPDWMKDFE